MPHDIESLLAPVAFPTFLRDHYEQKVLHLTARPPRLYADLFSRAELDAILWQHENTDTVLLRSTEHERGEQTHYIERKNATRSWVYDEYFEGRTLVLHDVGRFSEGVSQLQRGLEAVFRGRVEVNVYLTPPNSQGLPVHYDSKDVFILQIEGAKSWQLYPDTGDITLPLFRHRGPLRTSSTRPPRRVRMRVGDLLYVPRGVVHEVTTGHESSLHLTVGLHPPLLLDVVREIVEREARRDVALRRSVAPDKLGAASRDEICAILSSLLETCRNSDAVERAFSSLDKRFVNALKPPRGERFGAANDAARVRASDRVERVGGMLCHVSIQDGQAMLSYPGKGVIGAPRFVEPALRFIASSRRPFRPSQLPGTLSSESKVVLVRRLIRVGVLRLASRSRASSGGRA